MEELEKFIKDRRAGFDTKQPPSRHRIDEALDDPTICSLLSEKSLLNDKKPSEKVWESIKNRLEEDSFRELSQKRKHAFDAKNPPSDMWERIELSLDGKEKIGSFNTAPHTVDGKTVKQVKMVPASWLWSVAASFALLLAAMFAWQVSEKKPVVENLAEVASQPDQNSAMKSISPELAEAEGYYVSMIAASKNQIEGFAKKGLQVEGQDFIHDLAALDAQYDELKKELIAGRNQEQIAAAMIQNLRIRMGLLERQIDILQKIAHKEKTTTNEKINV